MSDLMQVAVVPQVRRLEGTGAYGKFEVEPLEPGFGITLGNTLRRVLLSSLWGAAVTSVQIDGVLHEFGSIPHTKEDVSEVILNLKELRVKSYSEDPVNLVLDIKGPADVKAADIQPNSDVEIANPELHLCSVGAKGSLHMELSVERGRGYIPAERNKHEGQPIGVIPIDSIFSPVHRVNFNVEKTRVGQDTDYDRLLIQVWTDGTMSPEEAVSRAAEMFSQHLDLFVHFSESLMPLEGGRVGIAPANRFSEIAIEELELGVRAFNCLKAHDITTVGLLLEKKQDELLGLRNFGQKSLDEIKAKLVEKGYVSAEDIDVVMT